MRDPSPLSSGQREAIAAYVSGLNAAASAVKAIERSLLIWAFPPA